MFLALLINPILCLFHIIIHALFKSLLFLLCGSIINININQQSINLIKINNNLINLIFIVLIQILILSISKELIINNINFYISSLLIFMVALIGSIFTILYSIKILFYLFNYLLITKYNIYYNLIILIIISLLTDEFLEYIFNISSFSLFYNSNFNSILFYINVNYYSIIIYIIYLLFIYLYLLYFNIRLPYLVNLFSSSYS